MNKNTFSIVIPAHNGEQFIRAALRSALNQTRSADEVIVIDDASADRTGDIIRAPEFRGQVTYFYNKHSTGFADAWNRAAGKAGSDFVTILHQDDLLHPEYLYHIEKALLSYPVARHLYAACSYIDADGNVTAIPPAPHSPEPVLYSGKEYAHNYLNGVITNRHIHRCPGVMTARDLLLSECTYRKEAGHIADDDFFMRIGMHTDVVGISQPLASYRHHQESATGKLNSLTHSLARDYLYQAGYYHAGSSLLDQEDITKINSQAVRFINLLLFQSLRDRDAENKSEAFRFKRELEILLPGFMEKALPAWGRIMWKMVPTRGSDLIARQYVSLLALAISVRNFVRRYSSDMTGSNVAYVLIALPVLLLGGTEVQTLHLVQALSAAGYSITVCCYYEYDSAMVAKFEEAGAKVLLMKYARAEGLWHLAKSLLKLLRTLKPDIVHVQYLAPGLVPVLAARLAGIKIIFATVHQPGTVYGIKEKMLLRLAAQLCSTFFCVSQAVEKSWFGDSKVFDPGMNGKRKHFTIYNAVEVEKIAAIVSAADKQALLNELDLIGQRIIGFVGRLRQEKGLHLLIDAMPKVLSVYPDTVLVVVGDGPDRQELKKRTEEQKIGNKVIWLGHKSSEEVYRLYSIMDVVAVPSLFEGFGLSAAEAMAAGVPVVATTVDGLTEVVVDNETGCLVPAGDIAALSRVLQKLLSDRTGAREMGRKGQVRVRELFSMEKFSQAILTAYRELA